MHPWHLQSTSINIPCICMTFRKHSVWLWDLPSTSVNFPCGCSIFSQLLSTFCTSARFSVNFPCKCGTFRKPSVRPSISIREDAGSSVNLPCCRRTFHQLTLPFYAASGPTVNFCVAVGPSIKFLCFQRYFCPLLSTFCVATGPSVNFSCIHGTFLQLPSLSVLLVDFLSTSVFFPCGHGIFS